jgi:membrane protease YdiL (CAAX protease family)
MDKNSLLIATSPFLFFAIGLLTYPAFSGHWFSFEDTKRQFDLTTPINYINWILPFITYSILEEFGWRGFLLPHLQERNTAFRATIILTVIWALWHLPFFLWRFQFSLFISIGFFFSIFVGAIIITSIFNFSGGNIVPVILFHFANNLASALDKEYIVAVVSTCFIFLAIYIVKKFGSVNLSDLPRVRNYYIR